MSKVKIQVLDNGPYMVKGEVEILDGEGKLLETKQECYLCRCGLSQNQPYCSGAHIGKLNNVVRSEK